MLGFWKCSKCPKEWVSAYTWVSLQKFITRTPGVLLSSDDFYMQKCNRCKNDSVIQKYEPLRKSDATSPHKRNLCAKCQNDDYCDAYYSETDFDY